MQKKLNIEERIPSTWCQVPFSDLFLDPKNNIVGGPFGSNLKSSEYRAEGIPVFRIQNIGRNKFFDKNINFITEEKAEFLSKHSFKSGDIIITKLGDPLGKTCFVPKKYETGIIVADLIRARIDNKNINPKFLVYQFNSPFFIKQFDRFTKGTTRPRIKLSVVRELWFNLPPLKEQERIVNAIEELFSDLDNGIHNLKIAQNQLKVYRQALLKYAFTGKLTEEWRKKNTPESAKNLIQYIEKERKKRYKKEFEDWNNDVKTWKNPNKKIGKRPNKPKKYKNLEITANDYDNFQDLPKEWVLSKIANISLVSTGITPLKSNIEFYKNGKIPWVTSGALNEWVVTKPTSFVTKKALEDTSLKLFPKNTLLVAMYGEGKTRGTCSELAFEATTNQAIAAIIQTGKEEVLRKYLKFFLLKNYTELRRLAVGGAQPNLNLGIIENTVFPVPTEAEAGLIVNELESQFSIIEHLEKTIHFGIRNSEILRQSILNKAFEGELVDQEPIDEPAKVLLKRIQKERKNYQSEQKLKEKKAPKKTRKMSKKLSIIDVLKASNKPMLAKDVWQQSTHSGDIERFYSELKDIQDSIKEVKKGTESLLSFTK